MNNFHFVGRFDIRKVVTSLNAIPYVFSEETWRQKAQGTSHSDTETAFVRYPKVQTAFDVFESKEVENRELYGVLSIKNLIQEVALKIQRTPARILIARLAPGSKVLPHIDEGGYAISTERFHVALATNPNAYLHCGEEKVNIAEGECFWFNKHILHRAENSGSTSRMHLIMDFWET